MISYPPGTKSYKLIPGIVCLTAYKRNTVIDTTHAVECGKAAGIMAKIQQRVTLEPFEEKPNWLIELIRTTPRFGPRRIIGARKDDINRFQQQLTVQLTQEFGEPQEIGRNLIDIDCKELRNNGTKKDTYTLITAKKSKVQRRKAYQLNIGKRVAVGGEFGFSVGADFFNIGGISVAPKIKYSREKTKETKASEEQTRTLSQEYGVDGAIPIPPKTFVKLKIKTYAVSYSAQVKITVKMPSEAKLQVLAPRAEICSCGGSRMIWITAEDYLKAFLETRDDPQRDNDRKMLSYETTTTLQYLGEITEVHKQDEQPID